MQLILAHFCCKLALLLRLSSILILFFPQQLCYELSSWSVWAKLSYTPARLLKQSLNRSQLMLDVLQKVCGVPLVLTVFIG